MGLKSKFKNLVGWRINSEGKMSNICVCRNNKKKLQRAIKAEGYIKKEISSSPLLFRLQSILIYL